jgi:hypothetical protein
MLASAPLADACTLQMKLTPRPDGNSKRVNWNPVPGATQYDVFERSRGHDFHEIIQVESKPEPFFIARPTSTEHQSYEYLIVARADRSDVSCVGTTGFEMDGDQRLAELTLKRIVPLVGSVRGANGSDFRTSLLLRVRPAISGRIVFRPTGTLPSDNDPSLRYEFGSNNAPDLYWDDVIAAMGASGTGSLELIPDPGNPEIPDVYVPEMNVRVYNVTPQGTFGSRVASVHPADWVRLITPSNASYTIPPVHGNYRRNAGFRTITQLSYRVNVIYADGTSSHSVIRELAASYTWFGSVEALVGASVPPDARVFVQIISGAAIGFYTETENSTNDPTVVIRNPNDIENVVSWSF